MSKPSPSNQQQQQTSLSNEPTIITILSYNVNWGYFRERCKSGCNLLRDVAKLDADIVCLQETTYVTEEQCSAEYNDADISDLYDHQYFFNCESHMAGGIAILCRKGKFALEQFHIQNFNGAEQTRTLKELQQEQQDNKSTKKPQAEAQNNDAAAKPSYVSSVPAGIVLFQPQHENSTFPILVAQVRHIATGKLIMIANCHLRPPISLEDNASILNHASAYFSTDGVRLEETKQVLAKMKDLEQQQLRQHLQQQIQQPSNNKNNNKNNNKKKNSSNAQLGMLPAQIILGDMNEGLHGSSWQYLGKQKYEDVTYKYNGNATTWIWPVWGGYSMKGFYDHIFYMPMEQQQQQKQQNKKESSWSSSPAEQTGDAEPLDELDAAVAAAPRVQLKPTACKIYSDMDTSDHYPVLAAFELL